MTTNGNERSTALAKDWKKWLMLEPSEKDTMAKH